MALLLAVTMGACGSTDTQASAPTTPPAPNLALDSAAGKADAAIYPQRSSTYVLDGALADLGKVAGVRKLVAHHVSDADLTRIVSALGMHGTPQPTGTGYVLNDGAATLTVDTSGAAAYVDYSAGGGSVSVGGSAGSVGGAVAPDAGSSSPASGGKSAPPIPQPVPLPMPTLPPPVDVPSADDAATIAQSLLDDLGVLAGQQWSHVVSDSDATMVACAADAPCPPTPTTVYARTVAYHLVVDGVEIPGIDWSVTTGEHRRVTSVSGSWGTLQNPSTYPLRSTAGVFDDLKNGRAQYVGPQPLMAIGAPDIATDVTGGAPDRLPAIEVHVTGVSLGLARWDGTEGTTPVAYLVPTYRFHAKVADGAPYDIEVLALDPANFTIGPNPGAAGSGGKEVQK